MLKGNAKCKPNCSKWHHTLTQILSWIFIRQTILQHWTVWIKLFCLRSLSVCFPKHSVLLMLHTQMERQYIPQWEPAFSAKASVIPRVKEWINNILFSTAEFYKSVRIIQNSCHLHKKCLKTPCCHPLLRTD